VLLNEPIVLLIMPELISIMLIFVIVGLRGLKLKFQSTPLKVLVHIGKISYSGYIFHLFVLDFFLRGIAEFISLDNNYLEYLTKFITYIFLLIFFSHVSYNAIELPFLKIRKQYAK
jgi:peptidoglycan/LPS O-acetylase OafA/YrhL